MRLDNLRMDSKFAPFMAIIIALAGLALLYFWPSELEYGKIPLSQAILKKDGTLVQAFGEISLIQKRAGGASYKICDEGGSCASAVVSQKTKFIDSYSGEPKVGDFVIVYGEIGSVRGNKFIDAHKIS